MTIQQGAIYWVQIAHPQEMEPRIAHPHVIIDWDILEGHPRRLLVCALTSNAKKFYFPGNVLLEAHEANLPRQSAVEVSKKFLIDKAQLGAYVGLLSEDRMQQILAGMHLVQRSFFNR